MSEATIIEFPQDGRPSDIGPEEWQARCELAAAYRLCALYGWTDLNNTHLSLRVPGTKDHFLLNPFGMFFEEITASSLIKVDGEGNLNSKIAENYIASRGARMDVTQDHYRNGKVENRHALWKGMVRSMLDASGLDISFWYMAFRHAVMITNLCLLTTSTAEGEQKMSIWEKHFGEKPDISLYLIGPFGCLCYLILTEEQRRERHLSQHFGMRANV